MLMLSIDTLQSTLKVTQNAAILFSIGLRYFIIQLELSVLYDLGRLKRE